MARRSKKSKSKPRKVASRGDVIQTVRISLGGKGGLEELYKKQFASMGGSGSSSSAMYPSSPSYYRLVPPNQQFAQTPDAISGRNQAVPNNLVSQTLINPSHGNRGSALATGQAKPTFTQEKFPERKESLLSKAYSQRFLATPPEPNRPISAVQSEMVAGRPIIHDPSLPPQKPAGRDNYVMPYDAEHGAPDSGYFPQQAQAPVTTEEEMKLQQEVAQSVPRKIKRPEAPPSGYESPSPLSSDVVFSESELDEKYKLAKRYADPFSVSALTKDPLRDLSRKLGINPRSGSGYKSTAVITNEINVRVKELLNRFPRSSPPSSPSGSSSGAF